MLEFNVVERDAPLDRSLTVVMFARTSFLLPVKPDCDPLPVVAGQRLVLNDEAFAESDLMSGALVALLSVGALTLVRSGVLH
jgi:hypothetical protein